MSSTSYQMPWAENKIRTIDLIAAAEQGQLLAADGSLATKGTTTASTGKRARYIAGASAASGARIGAYQNCVISSGSISSGTAGDDIYLGADGAYTLVEPTSGDSDIKQVVGFVRADGRGQLNLESSIPTVL